MNGLIPIEYQGQRVLLTVQLAESYVTDVKIVSNNYNRNKERYTAGKHYFLLQGEELSEFKASHQFDEQLKFATSLYLWTEKGAWLHAKSLNTDRAWEAYEALVDEYYRMRESGVNVQALSQQMQMFKLMWDSMAAKEIEDARRDRELVQLQSTVTTMQDTLLHRDDDWRNSINTMLKGAAFRTDGDYRGLRNKSYQMLEERGRCDLGKRLRNLQDRLAESGATKTKINSVTRMDVIEAEPRLKEIYTMIAKEMSIGSLKVSGR